MTKQRDITNPFYVILTIVGVLFVLTASAYGVMTVTQIEPGDSVEQSHPLISLMDEHGLTLLMTELGILAVATFAAIGTDGYWTRESNEEQCPNEEDVAETETVA